MFLFLVHFIQQILIYYGSHMTRHNFKALQINLQLSEMLRQNKSIMERLIRYINIYHIVSV